MRDILPQFPFNIECVIVDLNTSDQSDEYVSHWVCYYRNRIYIFYFDSYGQIPLVEIQRYLMTGSEFKRFSEVVERNKDIV